MMENTTAVFFDIQGKLDLRCYISMNICKNNYELRFDVSKCLHKHGFGIIEMSTCEYSIFMSFICSRVS